MPWREKSLKVVHEKMLRRNDEAGASTALIRFDKGAGIPQPHDHASNQFLSAYMSGMNAPRLTCCARRLLLPKGNGMV